MTVNEVVPPSPPAAVVATFGPRDGGSYASAAVQTLKRQPGVAKCLLFKRNAGAPTITHAIVQWFNSKAEMAASLNAAADTWAQLESGCDVFYKDTLTLEKETLVKKPTESSDLLFIVGFEIPSDKINDLVDDWFQAMPVVAKAEGFRTASMYKTTADRPEELPLPFFNLAWWQSKESLDAVLVTPESRRAHAHQVYVVRKTFVGALVE
eukprot:jgi/Chlat1/885/Chrsp107S01324